MADKKTSKNAVILQPAKPKKGRRASAVLKPAVRATPKVAPIQKLASTARLTSKQRAVSQTLPSDQKLALREREAARIYATGIEQHKNNNLNAAIESYGKSLILNPKTPEVYNNMGAA
ncbi:MAG: tetratricopeptide repeat protein, partial [Rhodospirillales bacterium]